jgi:peroxiredoxin
MRGDKMRRINSIILMIAVLLLSVSYCFASEAGVGEPAPKVILNDIKTNQASNLSEIGKGKVSVVVYMQTSCAACRKELEAIKSMLSYVPELNVVAISVDAGSPARILKYIEHYQFPFTFLHDPSFTTPELFGFSYTPATVVIGKDGKIVYLKGGYRRGDEKRLLEVVQEASGAK